MFSKYVATTDLTYVHSAHMPFHCRLSCAIISALRKFPILCLALSLSSSYPVPSQFGDIVTNPPPMKVFRRLFVFKLSL